MQRYATWDEADKAFSAMKSWRRWREELGLATLTRLPSEVECGGGRLS